MITFLSTTRVFSDFFFEVHFYRCENKRMGSKSVPASTATAPKAPTNKADAPKAPANTPNAVKFLIGGVAGYVNMMVYFLYLIKFIFRMTATLFVNPMDLVKNRMQMSGAGGAAKEYKTSFDALTTIFRKEGFRGIYAG